MNSDEIMLEFETTQTGPQHHPLFKAKLTLNTKKIKIKSILFQLKLLQERSRKLNYIDFEGALLRSQR